MLLAMAPHRVWPLRFGVPVYADSRVGTLWLKAGLTLYDFLARRSGKMLASPDMAHRHFDRQAFAARFPALKRGKGDASLCCLLVAHKGKRPLYQ